MKENSKIEKRLKREIKHGQFLAEHGAVEIWNWESPAGRYRWKRRVKMLTSQIEPNTKVLELGCGTGYFTKEIIKTGAFIVAIDISPDLIEIAKNSVKSNNVIFKTENAFSTSFSPAATVISFLYSASKIPIDSNIPVPAVP